MHSSQVGGCRVSIRGLHIRIPAVAWLACDYPLPVTPDKSLHAGCKGARHSMPSSGMLHPHLATSSSTRFTPIDTRKHDRKARNVHTTVIAPVMFTPETAAIGGITLGVATAAKYCLTGRILGISGTVKGIVCGEPQQWRFAFTSGLVGAGLLAATWMPGALDVLPGSYSVSCRWLMQAGKGPATGPLSGGITGV